MKKLILIVFCLVSLNCFGQNSGAVGLSANADTSSTGFALKKSLLPYITKSQILALSYAVTSAIPISANPTGISGVAAVNGTAPTWMRSDAAPKVDSAAFATKNLLSTYLTKAQILALSYLTAASSLAWANITGSPTTIAGYGITNGVTTARTIAFNGTTYDLTANRTFTTTTANTDTTSTGFATRSLVSTYLSKANIVSTYSPISTTVTGIGVTTSNGVSATSSGGTTPNLTVTLGKITPSSINTTIIPAAVYQTGAGTAGTDSVMVKHSGGIVDAISPTYYAPLVSPSLVTPTLGVAAATTINKVTITAPATSAVLTIANGKTLTVNNSVTIAGTDATTMTFPTTSATVARTDAANTFTGVQTMTSPVLTTPSLGVATATSINGNTITTGTGILTLAAGTTISNLASFTFDGSGKATLVAGTKAITITGITTSSIALVSFVSAGGTLTTTTHYAGVCTLNTLTITALTSASATNASDTSIISYLVVN